MDRVQDVVPVGHLVSSNASQEELVPVLQLQLVELVLLVPEGRAVYSACTRMLADSTHIQRNMEICIINLDLYRQHCRGTEQQIVSAGHPGRSALW